MNSLLMSVGSLEESARERPTSKDFTPPSPTKKVDRMQIGVEELKGNRVRVNVQIGNLNTADAAVREVKTTVKELLREMQVSPEQFGYPDCASIEDDFAEVYGPGAILQLENGMSLPNLREVLRTSLEQAVIIAYQTIVWVRASVAVAFHERQHGHALPFTATSVEVDEQGVRMNGVPEELLRRTTAAVGAQLVRTALREGAIPKVNIVQAVTSQLQQTER